MNRNYQIIDILIDKDIDESLKCGLCKDIPRVPILCGGGHSWCFECIRNGQMKACIICSKSIDFDDPTHNISLKKLIDKMLCRCPNVEATSNNTNGRKRKNEKHGCCTWSGRFDQLDNHLQSCSMVPRPCEFELLGCDFVGDTKQLDDHYSQSCRFHSTHLLDKILKLEEGKQVIQLHSDIEMEKTKISAIEQEIMTIKKRLKSFDNCNRIKTTTVNSNTIHWTIRNVADKLRDKAIVDSESFDIVAANGNKYKMKIQARFAKGGDKDLGIFLGHVFASLNGYSNQMPVDIGDSTFTLHHEDANKNHTDSLSRNCLIEGANKGKGWLEFCKDLTPLTDQKGFINNDEIRITAIIKINDFEKHIFTA